MFLAWSKQLENEGMGTRIGVSSSFICQSLSSMTVYIIFGFFLYYRLQSSLFRKLILFLFSVVYCDIKALFLLKYIQSFFLKVGTEIFFIGLKSINRIVTKKQYTLYVGGYSAENFFEARFNFNEIMSLELFNQGIGLQVCINTSNFCHGATFFCICQLPWILEHD